MRKTIFERLFWSNAAIIILIFAVLSLACVVSINKYISDKKFDNIIVCSRSIGRMVIRSYTKSFSDEEYAFYNESVRVWADFLEADITIVDKNGTIKRATSVYENIPPAYIENILKGDIIRQRGSFIDDHDRSVMTVGVPVLYEGEAIGAMIFSTEINILTEAGESLVRILATAAVGMFFAAFMALSSAANEISKGKFTRIYIEEGGEIGELVDNFNSMSESLKQLEEMRSQFVSDVSHELRTPMTSIAGFVQGILDKTIPPEMQDKYLNIVLSETHRLTRLINDMLDATRYAVGNYVFEMVHFNINALIEQTSEQLYEKLSAKNMKIDTKFEQEELFVYADEDSIKRVVINLLDNAVKFGKKDTSIEVKTKISYDKAVIEIGNYGEGIRDEDIKNIFRRFYKADKSRANSSGTGIGLYLTHNIIEEHGESIKVESKNSANNMKYTVFTFTLKKSM